MNAINGIASFIFLLVFGSFLLKEGLHRDSPKEKMLKATALPAFRHYSKTYLIILGATAIFADLYLAWRYFFK
jgi:fucose permease